MLYEVITNPTIQPKAPPATAATTQIVTTISTGFPMGTVIASYNFV